MKFTYRNPRYGVRINRYRFYSPLSIFKWNKQRKIYGVSEFDCFGFDTYLTHILANGLQELVKSKCGIPMNYFADKDFSCVTGQDLTDADIEKWNETLGQAASDAAWLIEYENYSSKIYDKHHEGKPKPSFLREPGKQHSLFVSGLTDEESQAHMNEQDKLDEEREFHKDRLMDFVKENFWSLWS